MRPRGAVVRSRASAYLLEMAAKDLDGLIERIRHLSPEGLTRVAEVIKSLERATHARTGRFAGVCGSISADDAVAMRRAVEDCEQVDPRGW